MNFHTQECDGDNDWPAYPFGLATLCIAIVLCIGVFVLACIGAGALHQYVQQFIK